MFVQSVAKFARSIPSRSRVEFSFHLACVNFPPASLRAFSTRLVFSLSLSLFSTSGAGNACTQARVVACYSASRGCFVTSDEWQKRSAILWHVSVVFLLTGEKMDGSFRLTEVSRVSNFFFFVFFCLP